MGEEIAGTHLLDDAAWRRFEEWVHRRSADSWSESHPSAAEVCREIDEQLNEPGVRNFLHRLGVLGTAPLMAPIWERNAVFFFRDGLTSYRTPYLRPEDTTGDPHPVGNKGIHQLFLAFREQQVDRGSVHAEDFYYWLPSSGREDRRGHPFLTNEREHEIRQRLRIHYCTAGEILFTLLAWRVAQSGSVAGRITLDTHLRKGTEIEDLLANVRRVLKDDPGSGSSIEEVFGEIEEVFGGISVGDLCYALGLLERTGSEVVITGWAKTAARFAYGVGLLSSIPDAGAPERFITELLKGIPPFLKVFGDGSPSDLFKHARFPIWAYYFWVLKDRAPRCYLVAPVWSSPYYAVSRIAPAEDGRSGDERISTTGLAIAAVAPLSTIDWSLDDSVRSTDTVRRTEPRDLLAVLHALTEPAVEILYYHQLHTKLLDLRRREVLSGILARNLSHNVGSHVLANPSLIERVDALTGSKDEVSIKSARRRILRTFVSYLQQRLDFIARMVSRTRQPAEPLFFFADVLYPFFRQELLLDTLLDDLDYPGEKLSIVVTDRNNTWTASRCFDQRARQRLARREGGAANAMETDGSVGGLRDFVVGIPGGIVGCHALYAVLENIIRNSTKYGTRLNQPEAPEEFQLDVELTRGDAESMVTIHDNLSEEESVGSGTLREELKRKLETDPIDLQGLQVGHSHGLHEIRMCCTYLSGQPSGPYDHPGKMPPVEIVHVADPTGSGRPHRIGYRLRLAVPRLLGVLHLQPARGER